MEFQTHPLIKTVMQAKGCAALEVPENDHVVSGFRFLHVRAADACLQLANLSGLS